MSKEKASRPMVNFPRKVQKGKINETEEGNRVAWERLRRRNPERYREVNVVGSRQSDWNSPFMYFFLRFLLRLCNPKRP